MRKNLRRIGACLNRAEKGRASFRVVARQVQQAQTRGVLLLAGFSAGLLKSFLAGRLEEFTPAAQLASVLAGEVNPRSCLSST